MLKLKNPWAHVRWKGRYSELDEKSWTPQLREMLDYDPTNAASFDNGVFWIDYNSVLHHFNVFCMNWNPKLFPYTSCIHKYSILFVFVLKNIKCNKVLLSTFLGHGIQGQVQYVTYITLVKILNFVLMLIMLPVVLFGYY